MNVALLILLFEMKPILKKDFKGERMNKDVIFAIGEALVAISAGVGSFWFFKKILYCAFKRL